MLFGVIFELPFDRVAEALIEMVGNATFFRAHRHVPLLLRRSAFVNDARVRPLCARGARLLMLPCVVMLSSFSMVLGGLCAVF